MKESYLINYQEIDLKDFCFFLNIYLLERGHINKMIGNLPKNLIIFFRIKYLCLAATKVESKYLQIL